jgi:hypothetical protein
LLKRHVAGVVPDGSKVALSTFFLHSNDMMIMAFIIGGVTVTSGTLAEVYIHFIVGMQ